VCLFLDDSSFTRLLKQQITCLYLRFRQDLSSILTIDLNKDIYAKIFALGEKLTNLDFDDSSLYEYPLSLHSLPANSCHSSTLLNLTITVSTFDDCLVLLDGRLCHLSTFNVTICHIDNSSLTIDNTVKYYSNNCFNR
jgi:hypothetical protein